MSKTRSKKSKNSPIPMFIGKLLQIVENQQITETVSWTTTRDSFNIKNISRFTQQILPQYFKHHNFASFIRQLNMYGFKKIRHPDGDNVYMNQHFKQGSRHLLANIVRKLREEKEEELAIYSQAQNPNEGGRVGKQIHDLKTKQKNLEEMCKRFLVQNQKLLEENQNLVKKMEKDSREKEKRLEQFLIYLLAQKNSRALTTGESGQLALTNNQAPISLGMKSQSPSPDATPLQLLANNMDHDEGFRKMKTILQNAYNNRNSRRRQRNFTIIPHKQQQQPHQSTDPLHGINPLNHDESELISQIPMTSNHQKQQDNKSFLSINDFINAQDFQEQDFNLESSN